jgi:hypothetical protein
MRSTGGLPRGSSKLFELREGALLLDAEQVEALRLALVGFAELVVLLGFLEMRLLIIRSFGRYRISKKVWRFWPCETLVNRRTPAR